MEKTAYSYIRFSTKAQLKGDSLDRQLARARDYARRHELHLDEASYRDLGISAFKGKNATDGALRAFLDAVDDHTIPSTVTLLIENFDRLSRAQVPDALELFMSITKRGVTIVTLTDEQVYNTKSIADNWTKLIISLASMARAHEESATKSGRVRSGINASLEKGRKHGKCPSWLKVSDDKQSFDVVEEQAEIVRTVFRLKLGGMGALRIAHHLNAHHGMRWGSPQVARLLQNPAVIGIRISQAGREPLLDYYEPIISKTDYYAVAELMSADIGTKRGRRPEDEPNLFTGLVRCAHCGSRLRFFRDGKTVKQQYLRCDTSLNKAGCDGGFINYQALEKELIGWLLLDQDDDVVPILDKKPTRKVASGAETVALREQQSRLIDLLAGGLMNTRLVTDKLNALELQIAEHEAIMLAAPQDEEDRPFAEKAWQLVERHEDAKLSDDPAELHAIRREMKAVFQRGLSSIHVLSEQRDGDVIHCKFFVEFRGYDGKPERDYTRPALKHVKGVYNGRSR